MRADRETCGSIWMIQSEKRRLFVKDLLYLRWANERGKASELVGGEWRL